MTSRRTPRHQTVVNAFANKYLKTNEKRVLAKLLGKPVASLTFSIEEGMRLQSISDEKTFKGLNGSGPNYANFYDFVSTMDQVANNIQSLKTQVDEMDELNGIEAKAYLDKQILASDNRLWAFHDVPKRKTTPGDPDTSRGQRLGSKTYYHKTSAGAESIKPKEETEKSLDEAIILSFPTMDHLSALGQGQFVTNLTSGKDDWTNATDLSKKRINAPLLHRSPYLRYTAEVVGAGSLYKRKSPYHSLWGHSYTAKWYKDISGELAASYGTYTVPRKKVNGEITATDVPIVSRISDIHAKLAGFDSKRIAIAYKKSKAHEYMNKLYYNLQDAYTIKRMRTSLGVSTGSGLDIAKNRHRGLGLDTNLQCGPGSVANFVGHDGNPVRVKDAVITRNGKRYINTALVDPSRSFCNPGVSMNAMSLSSSRAMTLASNRAQLLTSGEAFGAKTQRRRKRMKRAGSVFGAKTRSKQRARVVKTASKFYGQSGSPRIVYRTLRANGSKRFFYRRKGVNVTVDMKALKKNNKWHKAKKKSRAHR